MNIAKKFILLFVVCLLIEEVRSIQWKDKIDQDSSILFQFGDNIAPPVKQRIRSYLSKFNEVKEVVTFDHHNTLAAPFNNVLLSFGNTKVSQSIIPKSELDILGPEGYVVRSSQLNQSIYCIAADGNAAKSGGTYAIGASFASYALLQELGFAFLHPLQPQPPSNLWIDQSSAINIKEKPYWEFRAWHIHTEHPLELTEFLNGFGTNFSTANRDDWLSMLPEWQSFLEWMLANRLNGVEWVLLCAEDWIDYAWSPERLQRFQIMIQNVHDFGISAGADMPIANNQQHAWYMITHPDGTLEQQTNDIKKSLNWFDQAGFDFLSTESGFSEFTHPDDVTMLAWMNITTEILTSLGKKALIKVHCSTGQTCKHYKNPWTGQPLNFNWLPIYADPKLGILPHTVQYYNFDQPTGGSYGNSNFSYQFDLITKEAGKREVIYHGETAYWVNYDIDVPLFLPIYASSRLYDLRKIATFEVQSKVKTQGYVNFDSGWEWGYWFSDVVTASASWNPHIELDEETALRKMIRSTTTRYFGKASKPTEDLLIELIELQKQLLVYGNVSGNEEVVNAQYKRNGQAYLEGWDTWSDLSCDFTSSGCTQPNRLGIEQCRNPFATPNYHKHVRPILEAMSLKFSDITKRMNMVSKDIPTTYVSFWNEMVDSTEMLSLRATQIFALYEYASTWYDIDRPSFRKEQLLKAKSALYNSSIVVQRREKQFRVPLDRITGWRPNPTAYPYTYLWTAHSLFYHHRDHARATLDGIDTLSPCFMNIINPADVVVGEGVILDLTKLAREVLEKLGLIEFLAECLSAPEHEPHYHI